MQKHIYIILILISPWFLNSCSESMDDISKDPNKPSQVHPKGILTNLSITTFGINYFGVQPYRMVWQWDGRGGGGHFNFLRRNYTNEYKRITFVNYMNAEAERIGDERYIELGKFFRAYWIFNITRLFGDVPYTEAGQGHKELMYPKFDDQEDIIAGLLNELEEANTNLAAHDATTIEGDIIYGGKIKQWRRLINTYRLRILMNCSSKETIKGQKVGDLFAAIVNNPTQYPLMEKLSDSATRDEAGNSGNYVYYNDNNFVSSYRVSKYIVDWMKERNDMRLPIYAEVMMKHEGKPGIDVRDVNNYNGVYPNPGTTSDNNKDEMEKGEQSKINRAWYLKEVGPSHMMIGYPELKLMLAEAVLRGWISGDAEAHYKDGIKSACEFRGVAAADITAYLAHPKVKFEGTDSEKLGKIITEKYMHFFMQGGLEPYFELRRTGYPNFSEYLNRHIDNLYNDGNLPLRYLYPLFDVENNNANAVEAINKLDRGDDRNSKMWMIKGTDPLFNPDPFPFRQY